MNIPFFTKKTEEGRIFLGLFLKEQQGIALVMKMDSSNIVLLDQEKFSYPHGWEHLPEVVDEVVLKLEQRNRVELHDTIFYVYSHFIDPKTKDIKKVYLDRIKDLVKRLDLKALGYIESYEAVLHFLEKKEEMPLTAVVIELDHSNISVFIYKRGELIHSKVLAHTSNLIDDLLMSFMDVKGKFVLPSRLILYNSKDLDNESTEIVTYRWSEELFVQLPRVEILKEFELSQGMIGVFAEQYGKKFTTLVNPAKKPKEEVMGFVIGEDVAQVTPVQAEPQMQKVHSIPKSDSLAGLKNFAKKFFVFPKHFNWQLGVFIGVLLIGLAVFLNEYFLHKATVTLFLSAKNIKKDLTLSSADITIEPSVQNIDLKDSKSATGKKEIGEKAKGSVTVHNFADSEKIFTKGTSIETGGVKFVLDQEIKVASASVVTISGGLVKQPGKTKVAVTADQIGPQGNVGSGKQFKIADFPNSVYFALNENSFSGGTKKDIKTAAKKDLDDLRKSVLDKAKKQIGEATGKKAGEKILTDLTEVEIDQEKFDKEVGEETDEVNLDATVKITSYSYPENKLKEVIGNDLKTESEKDFELMKDKIDYRISDTDKKGDEITLEISASGKTMKELPTEEIRKKLNGKKTASLEKLLKNDYKVEGLQVDMVPNIPLFKDFMPLFEKNITIKVSSL